MKKFDVALMPTNGFEKGVIVEADYFRIEAGVLIFRNSKIGNQYPEVVHCFAAGVWQEVEPVHE